MTTAYAHHPRARASLESVRVGDAMHRGIVTCRRNASLLTVARAMAAHRIHDVVVVPDEEEPRWGHVSDLDVVCATYNRAVETLTAGDLATTPALCVTPDDTLAHAARLMREHGAHHVLVCGRNCGPPIGIVSTLDVADVVAELADAYRAGGF